MAAVMFDTQKFVKRLQAAKFPPEQAEAQSDAMREVLETAFANHAKEQKEINARAVNDLDSKTEKAVIKLEGKIDNLEQRVNTRFAEIKGELLLLRWMLGVLIAGVVGLLVRAFFMS